MKAILSERVIKTAVIDKLFDLQILSDAVLINEMVVSNWSRRADLVVANGKLTAFEIKSDLDSLVRLEGQVQTYLGSFDKVIVVVTEKHLESTMRIAPEEVGVWCVESRRGGPRIKIIRRGQEQLVRNVESLCAFLRKSELAAFLRSQLGRQMAGGATRAELCKLAGDVPVTALRRTVLATLKSRYQETHRAFTKKRGAYTDVSDLDSLSRAKIALEALEKFSPPTSPPVDLASLPNARRLTVVHPEAHGDLGRPVFVLARIKKTGSNGYSS